MTVDDVVSYVMPQLPEDAPVRAMIQFVNRIEEEIRDKGDWAHFFKKGSLDFVAEYSTGTVAVNEGSATVTGTGTVFPADSVGRLFRVAGSDEYVVSVRVSDTELTLARNFTGDDATAQTFRLYQNEYEMPTDVKEIIGVWDVTNNHRIMPDSREDNKSKSVNTSIPAFEHVHGFNHHGSRHHHFNMHPWKVYSIVDLGTNDVPEMRFYPPPQNIAHVEIWYWRTFTAATTVDSTIDFPSDLDLLIKQGVLALAAFSVGDIPQGQREQADFRRKLIRKFELDDKTEAMSVTPARMDGGHFGHSYRLPEVAY